MGEGRYFTAHGAYPQSGYGTEGGGADHAPAADHRAPGGWQQPQWPGHAGPQPDMNAGYARGAAPTPPQGWPQAPAAQPSPYAHAAQPAQMRAEPQLTPPHLGQPRPQPTEVFGAAHPQGYGQMPYGYAPAYAEGAGLAGYQHPAQAAGHGDPAAPYQPPSLPSVSMAGVARGFGAVMSLVLLIGGGVWTWQMMQRDVSGVPVVRALEGPLRVAPDDPGGMQAAHQGLSVNELAAEGDSGLPDEIVLAPQPLDLERELQRPAQTAAPQLQGETLIEVGLPVPGATTGQPSSDPLGFVSPNRSAVTASPRPVARSARATRAPQVPSQDSASPAEAAIAAAVANSVAADLSRGPGIDVDPASIGPGTRLVQLGAYDSVSEARAAWDTLAQRFDPLLDDRGRVIEAAHSGGSVFYRLRAHGFADERDSRRFCAALIDQRLDCIPVLIR